MIKFVHSGPGGPEPAFDTNQVTLKHNTTAGDLEYCANGATPKVLVETAATQTLTNKTLTSPVFTGVTETVGVTAVTSATATLTAAANGGHVITLGKVDGIDVTLPAATGSGVVFQFVMSTTMTSDATAILAASASDTMTGFILATTNTDTATINLWPTTAATDTISFDGSTKGGFKGDFVVLKDIASGVWSVWGVVQSTGTEATPFDATVS